MNISKFLRSFVIGFAGFAHAIQSEQNMQLHCVAAVCVIAAGFALGLAAWEWIAVVFCTGLVISAECMNTAIERLSDRITLENDPLIKQAKDCGSGAVLMLACTAAIVGALIFVPKLLTLAGW